MKHCHRSWRKITCMNKPLFQREGLILGTSCVLSLYASGYVQAILEALPVLVAVANYVEQDMPNIYTGPRENIKQSTQRIELQPLLTRGCLALLPIDDVLEEEVIAMAHQNAGSLTDNDIISLLLAQRYNWSLGTDCIPCTLRLPEKSKPPHILSTLEILHYWIETMRVPPSLYQLAVWNVERRATFKPRNTHPLYAWWQTLQRA